MAVDDVHVRGKLTLGENTADNGGLRIAHMALMKSLADAAKQPEKIDGFTPEQRFFLGWGQIWCQNQTDQMARLLAQNNAHSPGKYRVNGVVQNMPEFQKAWGCKAGQPMVRAECLPRVVAADSTQDSAVGIQPKLLYRKGRDGRKGL